MAIIPSGGGSAVGDGGSGWIKIADVAASGGTVTGKVFQDAPNNTLLQAATVSQVDIQVTIRSSFPVVSVGAGTEVLSQAADGGHYEGTVNVTIPGTSSLVVTAVTPNGEAGATDTADLALDAPPSILTLAFAGGYPGVQTELKAGDSFQLSGTTDKDINLVEIVDYGACDFDQIVASGQSFTVTGTIADRGDVNTARAARVRVRDDVTGAFSASRDTNTGGGSVDGTDLVFCNNLAPTVVWGAITYPGGQQALKGSETASVAIAVANADTIAFTSPNGDLTVTNPSTIETPKIVTRIAGSYNVATANLRAVANRAANDASTTDNEVVKIANVASTIDVTLPAARLRSGGNDGTAVQNHTITIESDQQLLSVAMDEDAGGGTFTGAWVGGPSDWTRTLQVHDDDTKGTYNWQNLVATNLAGTVTSAISVGGSYELGGFVQRTLTFAAFATTTSMDVEVVTFSKLSAGVFTSTAQPALRQAIGTPPSVTNGYTIVAAGVKPTTLTWLDTPAAGANSGGTAQITAVEETV